MLKPETLVHEIEYLPLRVEKYLQFLSAISTRNFYIVELARDS